MDVMELQAKLPRVQFASHRHFAAGDQALIHLMNRDKPVTWIHQSPPRNNCVLFVPSYVDIPGACVYLLPKSPTNADEEQMLSDALALPWVSPCCNLAAINTQRLMIDPKVLCGEDVTNRHRYRHGLFAGDDYYTFCDQLDCIAGWVPPQHGPGGIDKFGYD